MNSLRFSFDGREESEAEYQARMKHREIVDMLIILIKKH